MTRLETIKNVPRKRKQMTYDELHEISIKNKDRYNQNVWTEKLLELNPEVKNDILEFEILMEHHHFRGKRVKPHWRCGLQYNGHYLLQDMSKKQWNKLKESEVS